MIDNLTLSARKSVRLRSHLNLHKSYEERVQRVLIGFVKDLYVEPHFHEHNHQWGLFQVLRGELLLTIYSVSSMIECKLLLCSIYECFAIEIPPRMINSLECLSDEAVSLEVKERPFDSQFAKVVIK